MGRYLVDTDILIDHEKGIPAARNFLHETNRSGHLLFLSVITVTELFAGLSPEDRKRSQPLISHFEILVMDQQIAETAANFLYRFQHRHGVGLGDAVIAATAYHLKSHLVTRNRKHYPMSELNVITPY